MVKRFDSYETLGAFLSMLIMTLLSCPLPITDKIWEFILDTILTMAEIIFADAREMLSAVVEENPKFHTLLQLHKLNAA